MYLLIDIGNSRIKWGVYDDENTAVFGACGHEDAINQVHTWHDLSIQSAWVASVGSASITAQIHQALSELGIPIHTVTAQKAQFGVVNAYADPSALGVDRWLGLLAAHHYIKGEVLVISVGTACTLDVLGADGAHQGGWILPGLSLMRKSLNEHTELLPNVSGQTVMGLSLGSSTQEAIAKGTLSALVSSIHALYSMRSLIRPVRCVLSGGNAEVVFDSLPEEVRAHCQVEPDWVIKGLAVVAELKLN